MPAAPEEPKLELKPPAPVELTVDLTPESVVPVEVSQAAPDAAAAPVPVFSGPAEFAANPEPIPDKTPPDQIRRIAFLYTAEQKEACEKFSKFIGQVAKTFGKKPIYVHQSARAEVRADLSPRELLDKLKAAGTVGILAILEGLPSDKAQELEKVFEDEDIFFRIVAPADAAKRLAAIDHVVDMMLLKAG
ncbi:MAG: hypothetical protein A2X36_08525 [Elusimicrobia bacterium GWA2_69_24]|nr:MAG: hypothetical protein A2X36_08525 [Elusimicrobia bacterium GWA2_69_24]